MGEKIYSAIVATMNDIGAIGKDSVNQQQGFKYRGVDAVMNALQPAMVKNKIFITPEVMSEERSERTNAKGTVIFCTRLMMKFTFFADDGSSVQAVTLGEAIDTGDKATNKAMAIAFKYACFQVFCIPTEEMVDPDAECHEVKPKTNAPKDDGWGDKKVEKKHIYVFGKKCEEKGIDPAEMGRRYELANVSEMTMAQFRAIMNELEAM